MNVGRFRFVTTVPKMCGEFFSRNAKRKSENCRNQTMFTGGADTLAKKRRDLMFYLKKYKISMYSLLIGDLKMP